MENERQSTCLDLEALSTLVHSYTHPGVALERLREIRKKCMRTKDLVIGHSYYYGSREDSIKASLKYTIAILNFIKDNSISLIEEPVVYQSGYGLHPLNLSLHLALPALKLQSTESQLLEWLPRLKNLEITACYAQTELAHGSYVRGIETEAIYNHEKQEFVINSPRISSAKWWIGGLGFCANYALVIAQLKIRGNSYGPHAFFIQIRDLETHEPLEGVEIGDIGPKMGLNHVDNGYLLFHNLRVSKKAMLNRFSLINEKGNYELVDKNGIKILYLSLVNTRFSIISSSWFIFSCALTIAIRYSIYRKQFLDYEKKGVEKRIIEYQIQQFKLFLPLSFLYGIIFSRSKFRELMEKAEKEVVERRGASLQYTHAVMSLFKAFFTENIKVFIEQLRASCGGHGYLQVSGIPNLYAACIPAATYEGDNHILLLQAIRYIVNLSSKTPPELFKFLFEAIQKPEGLVSDPLFQQRCIESITKLKLKDLLEKYHTLMARFGNKEKVWNEFLQIEGIETAEWVAKSIFHQIYLLEVAKIKNEVIRVSVDSLRNLYASDAILKGKGELHSVGVFDFKELKELRLSSVCFIRKNALALIEAFEIPDGVLNSAIGRKDVDVYKTMFEENARLNQLNINGFSKVAKGIINPKI